MKHIKLLALAVLVLPAVVWADTRYVTDELPIMVRRGQGTQFGIIEQVRSGTALEVLAEDQGYVQVRTPKGQVGWVVSRFLLNEPVARDRIVRVQAALDRERQRTQDLSTELTELKSQQAQTVRERDSLKAELTDTEAKLAQVSEAAASTLEIQGENEALKAQIDKLKNDREAIQQMLEAQEARRNHLLLGAGILLTGLILGLLLPHMRLPRRSGDFFD